MRGARLVIVDWVVHPCTRLVAVYLTKQYGEDAVPLLVIWLEWAVPVSSERDEDFSSSVESEENSLQRF
jgi:hypothetical protein